jgi:formylglycine-generating enzyme required for sulfatase activity
MNALMKRGTMISALGLLALLTPTTASAQRSIGSYSGCKKLGTSAKAACMECVGRGGGIFYQVASKTCGDSPDMKPSTQAPTTNDAPPPRPKKMPSSASQYVTIPAGSFRPGRGADETTFDGSIEVGDATVTISHPFLMKTTEVTQAEWLFVMGDGGTNYDKACGDNCGIGGVSWRRTLDYLNALSKREGLEACYDLTEKQAEWTKGVSCTGYRLPTEAE